MQFDGRAGRSAGTDRSTCMADVDRDLLFGLIALRVGLIDEAQLVAAFKA